MRMKNSRNGPRVSHTEHVTHVAFGGGLVVGIEGWATYLKHFLYPSDFSPSRTTASGPRYWTLRTCPDGWIYLLVIRPWFTLFCHRSQRSKRCNATHRWHAFVYIGQLQIWQTMMGGECIVAFVQLNKRYASQCIHFWVFVVSASVPC